MAISTSSYSIALVNSGAGIWTPTVRRNPTAPSGGTLIAMSWIDNNNNGANTTTPLLYSGLEAGLRAILNYEAANASQPSTFSFSAYFLNNGSAIYTPTVRLNPTQATGGTVVTLPWITNQNLGIANTATGHVDYGYRAAMRGILNDLANGN